jgi:mTERF domain-containing protein
VVKPNVVFLRKCGLGDCDISKLFLSTPRLLAANPEHVQAMVASAQGLGVPPGSAMFKRMLQAVTLVSEETIAAKLEYLKNMFRWSDAQVRIAVCKAPGVLTKSKESLQSRSKFLISDVGLAPAYIAQRSVMLTYSLEGRIRPRYYVLKFLKEKGLLPQDRDYYSVLSISEKVFMEKFICPHKEAAPKLAQDYAAACRGKMPIRFRFT